LDRAIRIGVVPWVAISEEGGCVVVHSFENCTHASLTWRLNGWSFGGGSHASCS
jgi:hypothetical protein